jgi:two-component system, OmpR family, sensor kinase
MRRPARAQTWVALAVASAMFAAAFAVATFGVVSASRAERARSAVGRVSPLVLAAFAATWNQPERRDALAQELARTLEARVELRGAAGERLGAQPITCDEYRSGNVVEAGRKLGEVRVCVHGAQHAWLAPTALFAALAAVCTIATVGIARVVIRPLGELARGAEHAASGSGTSVAFDPTRKVPREVSDLAAAVESMRARLARHAESHEAVMAALSHELRSPLARLRIAVDLFGPDASDRSLVDEIRSDVTSLEALVATLLDDARLQLGAEQRRHVGAGDLVADVELLFRPPPFIDRSRWVEVSEARVLADRTLLVRALALLVENAFVHGKPPVTVGVDADSVNVTFEVRDAGPRLDGARGAGLGLAIVERIVGHHAGTLVLDRNSAAGTVARITLPRVGKG